MTGVPSAAVTPRTPKRSHQLSSEPVKGSSPFDGTGGSGGVGSFRKTQVVVARLTLETTTWLCCDFLSPLVVGDAGVNFSPVGFAVLVNRAACHRDLVLVERGGCTIHELLVQLVCRSLLDVLTVGDGLEPLGGS